MAAPSLDQLLSTPMCRGLSPEEVGALLGIADQVSAPAGTNLFREGDPGDAVYVILSGQVEITKAGRGAPHTLARLSDGAILGEMSLIAGDAPRSATARVLTPLQAVRVPADRFHALLAKDSVPALKVVRNIGEVLSRRLLAMNEKIVGMVTSSEEKKSGELAEFNRLLQDWSF
jgi:CRP-like cAMP-binding protein